MTFSQWYSTNIEPGVIQNANQIPDPEQRALILKAARESMAACWNAALDAAWSSFLPTGLAHKADLAVRIGDALNAIRVKP